MGGRRRKRDFKGPKTREIVTEEEEEVNGVEKGVVFGI